MRPACDSVNSDLAECSTIVQTDKRAWLASTVQRTLTYNSVQKILDCTCNTCDDDRNDMQRASVELREWLDEGNTATKITMVTSSATSMLALFNSIRHPQLIHVLLHSELKDDRFFREIPQEDEAAKQCLEEYFAFLPKSLRSLICRSLVDNRHKYMLPRFDNGELEDFKSEVILPFVNENKIGGGATAHVYCFEIPLGYHGEGFTKGHSKFARKEFRDEIAQTIAEETTNLELANSLKSPHIVPMLKSYKHGTRFNIVFPCYDRDLNKILRGPVTRPAAHRLHEDPLWRQFLGVVDAIFQFSEAGMPNRRQSDNLLEPTAVKMQYGYHLDLKPENLLVDRKERLVVADFGQAHLTTNRGVSRVRQMGGGTDTYAPPEDGQLDRDTISKYDVWSLGCILLELMVYLVKGTQAVSELDQARLTQPGGMDEKYWSTIPRPGEPMTLQPILKRTIQEYVGQLCHETRYSAEDREFLQRVQRIAIGKGAMLDPDPASRCDIKTAKSNLEELLNRQQGRQSTAPVTQPISDTSPPRDSSYTMWVPAMMGRPGRTVDCSKIDVKRKGHDKFEITVLGTGSNATVQRFRDSVVGSVFIPLYAFGVTRGPPFHSCTFCFAGSDTDVHSRDACDSFWIKLGQRHDERTRGELDAAFAVQKDATGQQVSCSWDAEHVTLSARPSSSTNHFMEVVRRRSSTKILSAQTAEIWQQHPLHGSSTLRGSKSIYRLAMYSSPSIYLAQIKTSWSLTTILPTRGTELTFEPRSRHKWFACDVLRPPKAQSAPNTNHTTPLLAGIPIFSYNLEETLDRSDSYECTKLIIKFPEAQHATYFGQRYREVWKILIGEEEAARRA